jgi:hypothetical protein
MVPAGTGAGIACSAAWKNTAADGTGRGESQTPYALARGGAQPQEIPGYSVCVFVCSIVMTDGGVEFANNSKGYHHDPQPPETSIKLICFDVNCEYYGADANRHEAHDLYQLGGPRHLAGPLSKTLANERTYFLYRLYGLFIDTFLSVICQLDISPNFLQTEHVR